jgi:hypothetical protein
VGLFIALFGLLPIKASFNFSPVPAGYGIFYTCPCLRRAHIKTLPFGHPQPFGYKSLFSFIDALKVRGAAHSYPFYRIITVFLNISSFYRDYSV